MKKYERILTTIKEDVPLFKLYQQGLKPIEIKEAVVESLESYFENKDILEQFAIKSLVPESLNILNIQQDKWFFDMFEECLSTYHRAKSREPQHCFEACALWHSQILQSLSEFWSVLHLEVNKNALEIDEFLHECLDNIGDIIEGLTKPYLKVLLYHVKIAYGIRTSFQDIDASDLGKIVNELIQFSRYADLFNPPPWNIRLNQWRNIAYHHQAKIENGKILCWYGKKPNIKKVRLSRTEFLKLVQVLSNVLRTLKLAYTLFFIDNIEAIDKFSASGEMELREEAEFLNFAASLASQGFEIADYKKNTYEAKLVVKDISKLNPEKRRFHASQFLFPLWILTRSRKLIVEYRENNNTPNLLVTTHAKECKKIYDGKLKPIALAKIMGITDLKTNKVIPPFKDQ